MSLTTTITILGPIISSGLKLAHEVLKRSTPTKAKELEKLCFEKIDIETELRNIHREEPKDRNCGRLEELYEKSIELDKKISLYQDLASNEFERMSSV